MKNRIISIDIAKGLTIILVVFGHALQGIVDSNNLSFGTIYSSIYILKESIYSFHMPVFFMVSGVFIDYWIKKNARQAIFQKLRRLIYPYFIWSFLTAVFMQIGSSFTNNGLGLKNFMLSPLVPFSQFWFLYVLFFFFLVYSLSYRVLHTKYKFIMLIASLFFFFISPFVPNFWIFVSFSKYFVFFSIGTYILPFFSNHIVKSYRVFFSALLLVGIDLVYLYLLQSDSALLVQYLYLISSFFGCLFVFELSNYISERDVLGKFQQFIRYCGENSMQIYVMHLIPLAIMRIMCEKIFKFNNLWIIVLVSFSISFLLCIFFIEVFKKLRLNKIFFG